LLHTGSAWSARLLYHRPQNGSFESGSGNHATTAIDYLPMQRGANFKLELILAVMIRYFLALVLTSASFIANAEYSCKSDFYGNTTCRDAAGNTTQSHTDWYGNTTWRDNRGNSGSGHTDWYGNSSWRDDKGNTAKGYRDYYGNSSYRDSSGNTTRGTRDYYGNSSYRDNSGNSTNCYSDIYGNTRCR
jgi:hypothetical protein